MITRILYNVLTFILLYIFKDNLNLGELMKAWYIVWVFVLLNIGISGKDKFTFFIWTILLASIQFILEYLCTLLGITEFTTLFKLYADEIMIYPHGEIHYYYYFGYWYMGIVLGVVSIIRIAKS